MLASVLKSQKVFAPILGYALTSENTKKLDLSVNNPALTALNLADTQVFSEFIAEYQKPFRTGIGGYGEHRMMYQRSEVFGQPENARCIHLGTDLWGGAYTQVYAPIDGTVHSFAFNDAFGDYGATLILEHSLEDITFYTLYGHLNLKSISGLVKGQRFAPGDKLCQYGEAHENGHWPPHLHFQVIGDMLGKEGDFPGVASKEEQEFYLGLCPNPDLILRAGGGNREF